MSDFRFVEKLASSPWLCHRDHVEFLHGIFARYLDRAASGRALDVEAVEREAGVQLQNTRQVTVKDGVARIPVEGTIMRRASMFTAMSGGVSTDALMKDFHAAYGDPNVRSILLVFDTPGGEAHGINELAAAIREKRDETGPGAKRIESYVDGLCCSAGYWLASATDRITADPMAALGSIGVVTSVRNPKAAGEQEYLEFVSSRSPLKRPDPHAEEGREAIQGYVDDLGDEFISVVADNRGVPVATVERDFGRGWVLTGRKAVAAGLADALDSEEEATEALKGNAGARPMGAAAWATPTRDVAVGNMAATGVGTRTTDKEAASMAVRAPQTAAGEAGDQREAAGLLARIGNMLGISVVEAAASDAETPGDRDEPADGRGTGQGTNRGHEEQQSTDDGGEGDPSGESGREAEGAEENGDDDGEETDQTMTEARTGEARARDADHERGGATANTLTADERTELDRLRAERQAESAENARTSATLRKRGIAAMLDQRAGNIDLGDGKRGAMPKAQRDAAESLIGELAQAGMDPIVLSEDGTATLADSTGGRALGSLLTHWKPQELGERGTVEGEARTEGPQGDHERVKAELEKRELGMGHYGAVAAELAANGEIRKER